MTLDDAPIRLFVAFLVVVALWSARRIVSTRVARVAAVVIAVAVFLVAARLLVAPLPSERTLTWKAGFAFDPEQARTATVVQVEVERPACAPAPSLMVSSTVHRIVGFGSRHVKV